MGSIVQGSSCWLYSPVYTPVGLLLPLNLPSPEQYTEQVTRAEYDAQLAQRYYLTVDPDNRFVAAELERRWEAALQAVAEAREVADQYARHPPPPSLPPAMAAQLQDVGRTLPAL